MDIAQFKAANPDYKDVPDVTLADALHAKFYSDMPRDQFMQQVGVAGPGGNLSMSMRRDDYAKQFMADNPQADQGALDMALSQYDKQAATRTEAAGNAVQDRFKQLQSPEATFNARLSQRLQGQPDGVVPALPAKQQPDNANPATSQAPSTFDTVAGNITGGALGTLAGALASGAHLVGADEYGNEIDQAKAAIGQRQKELGGDTFTGKVASLVGGITPALAVPEDMVSQLVANAGLFAKPAFDDTYKAKLAQGYSRPLALAHAAEAFGINLFMPTVAARGSGAVIKGLGMLDAAGVKGAAAGLAQAAGEGVGFSAVNTALDKGTDLIAGQQNNNPWLDPEDMAVQATGFGLLRGAHMVPGMADAVAQRIAQARLDRARTAALDGIASAPDVDTAIAAATAAVQLPTKATGDDVASILQAIRPLDQAAPLPEIRNPVLAQHDNTDIDALVAKARAGDPSELNQFMQQIGGTPAELGARYVRVQNQDGSTGFVVDPLEPKGMLDATVPTPETVGAGGGEPAVRVGQADAERLAAAGPLPGGEAPVDARPVAENPVDRAVAGTGTDGQPALTPAKGGGWFAFPPETGTLGIPRAEMPQVKAEHRGPLVNFLNARGIDHEQVELPANQLKPTQSEFSLDKMQQAQDYKGGERSILASSDGHVLEGHHQWLAALEHDKPVKAIVLDAPIRHLLDQVREFPSATTAEGAPERQAEPQNIPENIPVPNHLDLAQQKFQRQEDAVRKAAESLAQRKATGGQIARDRIKLNNPFLAFLADHGVSMQDRADTGAEAGRVGNPMVPGFGPLYRRSGLRLDELALLAKDEGFLTDHDIADTTDTGGTRKLADMIQRAAQAKEVIRQAGAIEHAAPDADAQLFAEAQRLGVDATGKTPDQVYDAVVAAHAADEARREQVGSASVTEQAEVERLADQFTPDEVQLAAQMLDADIPLDGGKPSNHLSDEEVDAIFGIRAAGDTPADGRKAEGNPAEAAPQGTEGTGQPGEEDQGELLSGYTRAEIAAKQDAARTHAQAVAAERAKLEASSRKSQDAKETAARVDASAEHFQLGQSADDAVSGQNALFSKRADPHLPEALYYKMGELGDMRGMVPAPKLADWVEQRDEPGAHELADWLRHQGDADVSPSSVAMFMASRGHAMFSKMPVFYSALARAVPDMAKIAAKDGTVKPEQARLWLQARQKEGKFKADELQWSGVDDWLKAQGGRVPVADIETFVRDNGVQVQEVTKGASEKPEWKGNRMLSPDGKLIGTLVDEGATYVFRPVDGADFDTGANRMFEAVDAVESHYGATADTGEKTKYSSYVLPGGENYRELLLTLPTDEAAQRQKLDAINERYNAIMDAHDGGIDTLPAAQRAEVDRLAAEHERVAGHPIGTPYSSSHWDEPNIVAHVRFNDRTDADGKRVLFIEELQSDWAQQGLKNGFLRNGKATWDSFAEKGYTIEHETDNPEMDGPMWVIRDHTGDMVGVAPERQEAIDDFVQRAEENNAPGGFGVGSGAAVPDGPFVTDTKAWLALGLKRMIRYGAENGYDRVAFVSGDQSAARYDLSKQVDEIAYNKGSQFLRVISKDGETIFNGAKPEGELADMLGKEVADKIAAGGNFVQLQGDGLKIGGEGMKSFYDRIVPQVASDVLKKVGGGKLAPVDIDVPRAGFEARNRYEGPERTLPELKDALDVARRGGGDIMTNPLTGERLQFAFNRTANEVGLRKLVKLMEGGESFDQAVLHDDVASPSFAELMGGKYEKLDQPRSDRMQQVGFDITPALRAKALEGLPLFSKAADPVHQRLLDAAVAASGKVVGNTKPIDAAVLGQRLAPAFENILRDGAESGATSDNGTPALRNTLGAIALTGPRELRALARDLSDLLPKAGGIRLTVDDASRPNLNGAMEFEPDGVHLKLYTAEGRTGLSYETLLHETAHAVVAARYRTLSGALARGDHVSGITAPKAAEAMGKLEQVWNRFREASAGEQFANHNVELAVTEARQSPDEFFVRTLTDPVFQSYLAGREVGQKTLWQRVKDWVKSSLFGLKPSDPASWLDAAMTASTDLTRDMHGDAADFARTGADASTAARSRIQEDSPEFKKWFGASQAVDADGRPLVLYHGTASDFDKSKGVLWAAQTPEFASTFAHGVYADEGHNVMPVYMKIDKPVDMRGIEIRQWITKPELAEHLGITPQQIDEALAPKTWSDTNPLAAHHLFEFPEYIRLFKRLGYDGVRWNETIKLDGRSETSDTWATFGGTQVKSAIGNRGTFNPRSSDMLASRRAPEAEGSAEPDQDALRRKLARFIGVPKSLFHSALFHTRMALVPMDAGSEHAMAMAKDFANNNRRAQLQWAAFDKVLRTKYTPEQQRRMWEAADQENDLRREGKTSDTRGLASLDAGERKTVELLHAYGEQLWAKAKDAGLVSGDGVAFWTPRVAARIVEDGSAESLRQPGGEFSKDARNLKTSASSTKHRKYETTEESEAALKTKLGEDASYVKNIRVMPMAMAQLERAIAGRTLVNQIKAHGKLGGEDLFSDEKRPNFVTFDHPALKQWRPKMDWQAADMGKVAERGYEVRDDGVYSDGDKLASYRVKDGEVQKLGPMVDSEGKPVMESYPLYVRNDFAGPLKAVFTKDQGAIYRALMNLKGGVTSMIMISPLTHNLVIWGKAMPTMVSTMGWKNNLANAATLGLRGYFVGNTARADHALMRELVEAGLVPVSGRGMSEDVTAIHNGIEPGRSMTARAAGAVAGLVSDRAGDFARRAVDKAGEIWHERLLWDRVADLQAGMAVMLRTSLMDKGLDQYTANRMAVHFANRYAGMIPHEAMSEAANRLLNLTLFSKSFTMTNLGAYKDLLGGLPKDVRAQISTRARELQLALGRTDAEAAQAGDKVVAQAQSIARRKAASILILDVAAMAAIGSLAQALWQGQDGKEIAADFRDRLAKLGHKIKDDPLALAAHPLDAIASLGQTADNPHGKEDRVRLGEDEKGNTYYARLPVGKIGEELKAYGNAATGLHLLHNKMSTFVKPIADIMQNEDFTGKRIFKERDNIVKQAAAMGAYWVKSQIPVEDIAALGHLAKGDADHMDKLKLLGTATGLSVSRLSGGDAVAELRYQDREQQASLRDALPDVREALRRDDVEEAHRLLEEAGQTPAEIQRTIRRIDNPDAISKQRMRRFNQRATDEERERLDKMRQQR